MASQSMNHTFSDPESDINAFFMKGIVILCYMALFGLTTVLANTKACEYAGSNIGYIKSQTQKAIEADSLNMVHYYAFKALNAIEKSKVQFEACGCIDAQSSISNSLEDLKKATRGTSVASSRIFLERSLENTLESLEALQEHDETHGGAYGNTLLAMNTIHSEAANLPVQPTIGKLLEKKIDSSLIHYKNSLDKVVQTVECNEAKAYVKRIFEHCELELLKPELSEGKRYYNLRTKEITAAAMEELKTTCPE
jgi:hypothetical protein